MPRNLIVAACAAVSSLVLCTGVWAQDSRFQAEVDGLARSWAHVNYEIKDPRQEASEAQVLAARAGDLARRYPDRAEPMAWQALILLSEADARHNMHSLELCGKARRLLEHAAKIDPNAIGPGVIFANLGSLYAQVPGFPIGFGDAGKARAYFEKAIAANPDGLDANYFYGDFLSRSGDRQRAIRALEQALAAPARPGRELADRGRKWEASMLLTRLRHKAKAGDNEFAEAGASAKP
jgi:tetratricopeptide (TPR) repeat protein